MKMFKNLFVLCITLGLNNKIHFLFIQEKHLELILIAYKFICVITLGLNIKYIRYETTHLINIKT